MWITDLSINKGNLRQIAQIAGRDRWKIENQGFNSQKQGGFALERLYSHDYTYAKVFYFLLQMADLFFLLMVASNLFKNISRATSARSKTSLSVCAKSGATACFTRKFPLSLTNYVFKSDSTLRRFVRCRGEIVESCFCSSLQIHLCRVGLAVNLMCGRLPVSTAALSGL